jgi:hypothetical protein
LRLTNAQITDAGLSFLHGLSHLRHLDLRGTRVTGAGVAELQRALPHLQIERGAGGAPGGEEQRPPRKPWWRIW